MIESNYARFRTPRFRTPSGLLAGRVQNLDDEKRRPQPAFSLANNLPANAADIGVTVHGAHNGRGRASRQGPSTHALLPSPRVWIASLNESLTLRSHSHDCFRPRGGQSAG